MRKTRHLTTTPEHLEQAAEILRGGGLVAFPTETVYGLGANALSSEAVSGIFVAKGRPAWDPLIVHVVDAHRAEELTEMRGELRQRFLKLTEAFWPGPLTLLLPRRAVVPDAVTAGRATVGVRVPLHPVARALLEVAAIPVAAPSANRFGHVSPTTASHVLHDLEGRIDAVVDGGSTAVGVESTVLDPVPTPMVLYRTGAVTAEQIRQITGIEVEIYVPVEGATPTTLPSPGVGIRHYAPDATVELSKPTEEDLKRVASRAADRGSRVGVLLPEEWPFDLQGVRVERWGRWDDPASLAASVFAGLRALERWQVDVIVCPLPPPGDLRDAVRDRLLKAARPR